MTIPKKYFDYIIIFIALILGMWQLFFFKVAMKWDIVDIYLPWKYYVTECINNGILPLWNPFMNGGFSQMGDSSTWYPISWIVGLLTKYNLGAAHFEYLLHLFIAGIGFYKIGELNNFKRHTKLILAVSYMFSGFFISNAQHIGWLISSAWLPFVIYYFVRLVQQANLKTALKLALSLFLMLSGGYLGVFISTVYILLACFLYFLVVFIRNSDYEKLKKWTTYLFIAAIVFTGLSLIIIVNVFDVSAFITRGDGLTYNHKNLGILFGSLPLKALITFIYPFAASVSKLAFWGEDFSLINCYVGIIPIILFVYINLKKTTPKIIRLFSLLALFFMMIAIAQIFPFRKWLMILPFMELFRFPALFRIFAIFLVLIAAGYGFDKVFSDISNQKLVKWLLVGFLLFLFLVEIYLFVKITNWHISMLFNQGFLAFCGVASIKERVFLQGLILLLITTLIIIILNSKLKKNYLKWRVVIVCLMDMVIATQLNNYATVFTDFSPKIIDKKINSLPDVYPIPSLKNPITKINNALFIPQTPFLYKSLPVFYKIPSWDGNGPYIYKNTRLAEKNKTFDAIINNPLLFLATAINNSIVDTNTIDKSSYKKIKILDFNPNKIHFVVNNDKKEHLIFLQNYYHFWKAFVNGKPVSISKTNDTFMSILLNKGKNDVTFEFYTKKITVSFYISMLTLCFVILFFIIVFLRKEQKHFKNNYKIWLFFGLIGVLLLFVFYHASLRDTNKKLYSKLNQDINNIAQQYADSVTFIINVDKPELIKNLNNFNYVDVSFNKDILQLNKVAKKKKYIFYAQINKHTQTNLDYIFLSQFMSIKKNYIGKLSWDCIYQQSISDYTKNEITFNNFDKHNNNWTVNNYGIDSLIFFTSPHSFHLDSTIIYSPVFKKSVKEIINKTDKTMLISVMCRIERGADPIIVFQTNRGKNNLIWKGENIAKWQQKDNKDWFKSFMIINLKELNLKPDDIVSIYVWNNSKKQVWIDNLKVVKF